MGCRRVFRNRRAAWLHPAHAAGSPRLVMRLVLPPRTSPKEPAGRPGPPAAAHRDSKQQRPSHRVRLPRNRTKRWLVTKTRVLVALIQAAKLWSPRPGNKNVANETTWRLFLSARARRRFSRRADRRATGPRRGAALMRRRSQCCIHRVIVRWSPSTARQCPSRPPRQR
jgi:hypothetical protein